MPNKKFLYNCLALCFFAAIIFFSFHVFNQNLGQTSVQIASNTGINSQNVDYVNFPRSVRAKTAPTNSVPIQKTNNLAENQPKNLINISLTAGTSTYHLAVPKGNAYLAMQRIASTSPFSFRAKYYPSLGYFVESVNGVENSGGYYWTFYVNGKYSEVGASDYVLNDGDRVEWKYLNDINQ